MANNSHIPLAFGVGHWTTKDPAQVQVQREILEVLREKEFRIIDTARHYGHGESEKAIGAEGLASEFQIITKPIMALKPGGATKEGILEDWKLSSEALKTDKVACYVLHNPVDDIPISETMEGIQELYLAGRFEKFGLSNFSTAQVEECYHYALSKNYVLPTVYQGIYSLVARASEKDLFPTLRRLGIAFQAYSTLGSGFLVKTPSQVRNGVGNYNPETTFGKILQHMYGSESFLRYVEEYGKLAEESGNSKAGLAYRWVVWNGVLGEVEGDCVILGASSAKQLKQTISEIERGPLEAWVMERLDEMFKGIENDDPGDNFTTFKRLKAAGALG